MEKIGKTGKKHDELISELERFYAEEFTMHFRETVPNLEAIMNQLTSRVYGLFQTMFELLEVGDADNEWYWSDKKAEKFHARINELFKKGEYQKACELTLSFHLFFFHLKVFESLYYSMKQSIADLHSLKEEIDEDKAMTRLNGILKCYGLGLTEDENKDKIWHPAGGIHSGENRGLPKNKFRRNNFGPE